MSSSYSTIADLLTLCAIVTGNTQLIAQCGAVVQRWTGARAAVPPDRAKLQPLLDRNLSAA